MRDGISDVERLQDGRRPARGAVQPRARLPRRGRAGRRGRSRRSIRPPAYQSTVFTAGVSAPTDEMLDGIERPARRSAGCRRALLHLPLHHDRGDAVGGAAGIRVVVLDRPDPIGGPVQGNVLDTAYRIAGRPARRADALRHDAGRARPAGPGRPRARRPTSAWCRWPAGGAPMPLDADGPAVRPAEPEPPVARESLPLSRALSVRGDQPVASAADRTRRSSRSARRGSTPRPCCARCAAAGLPGVRFAGVPLHARRARATASTPTRLLAGIRLRSPTATPTTRPSTAVHLLAAVRAPVHADRVRLDPGPLRPAGRDDAAAGGDRGGHRPRRDRLGLGGRARAVPRAAAGGPAVSGVGWRSAPSSRCSRMPCADHSCATSIAPFRMTAPPSRCSGCPCTRTPRRLCPKQFRRLSFRPATVGSAGSGPGRLSRRSGNDVKLLGALEKPFYARGQSAGGIG